MAKHFGYLFLFCICSIFLFGCTYYGSLRNDFHTIDKSKSKLPLKACLIYDNNVIGKSNYKTASWFWHTADISFQAELQKATVDTLDSLFENLYVNSYIDQEKCKNADVIILPTIEIRDYYTLYMSMLIKDFHTDDVLQKYESSGEISWSKPASAHFAGIMVGLSCFILSPVFLPLESYLVGEEVQTALEERVSFSLNHISNDIRNDRSLVVKTKKVN